MQWHKAWLSLFLIKKLAGGEKPNYLNFFLRPTWGVFLIRGNQNQIEQTP
jgi:hypothetical protein